MEPGNLWAVVMPVFRLKKALSRHLDKQELTPDMSRPQDARGCVELCFPPNSTDHNEETEFNTKPTSKLAIPKACESALKLMLMLSIATTKL